SCDGCGGPAANCIWSSVGTQKPTFDLSVCRRSSAVAAEIARSSPAERGSCHLQEDSLSLGETLKYLDLLFQPDVINFDKVTFNTEAPQLRRRGGKRLASGFLP